MTGVGFVGVQALSHSGIIEGLLPDTCANVNFHLSTVDYRKLQRKASEKLSALSGPVYLDENNKNQFNIILKNAETLKNLAGPVYNTGESKHAFSELMKKVDSAKTLFGPIYAEGEVKHCFNQIRYSCFILP